MLNLRFYKSALCASFVAAGLTGCGGSDYDRLAESQLAEAESTLLLSEAGLAKGKLRRQAKTEPSSPTTKPTSPTTEPTSPTTEPTSPTTEPKLSSPEPIAPVDGAAASIPLDCREYATQTSGAYMVENNVWNKKDITDYYQCIGIGPIASDGSVSARWTWQWPHPPGAGEIKSYPEIIFGQKPGYTATPGSGLPKLVSSITESKLQWNTTSTPETYAGRGQLTFDIWLTASDAASNRFNNVPKTHEIMIAVENYGNYGVPPHRNPAWYVEDATIDGTRFHVYRGIAGVNWWAEWDFLVLQVVNQMPVGSVDFKAVLDYFRSKGWVKGHEYLASVEFGTEVAEGGRGEVVVHSFKVQVK